VRTTCIRCHNLEDCIDFASFACMETRTLCSSFDITVWDCMDIVDYLDYAGHVMLVVMFDAVMLCFIVH
jgi:hypothetical protein